MNLANKNKLHKCYLTVSWLISICICLICLALNCIIDPLWYFHGNQITHKNFAFNEREAKLNQLLINPKKYDCIIFGSSRTTLLPERLLSPYHCYNLSFSGGQIEEFIAYAEYLSHIGIKPKLVIVGVDGFNFQDQNRDRPNIPNHVNKKVPPPSFIKSYLSIDSLILSYRTLTEESPLFRYYNNRFEGLVRTNAPTFNPKKKIVTEGQQRKLASKPTLTSYKNDNATLYKTLTSLFLGSRTIGYVPPISAWHISKMHSQNTLMGYISAIYRTSHYFSEFWDFSIPSRVTRRFDNTYDGSHYNTSVNSEIARTLLENKSDWGKSIKEMSEEEYMNIYKSALSEEDHHNQ